MNMLRFEESDVLLHSNRKGVHVLIDTTPSLLHERGRPLHLP